jgi:hypothetical protein
LVDDDASGGASPWPHPSCWPPQLAQAHQQAAAILAEARAKVLATLGPRGAGGDTAAAVTAALSGLSVGDGAEAEQPAVLLRR